LKDESKSISERATRFLAVDMKDRLKSAFSRGGSASQAASAPAIDDTPDYSSIFAHRAQSSRKAPVNTPPQAQLAEPTQSVTMRNPARQIAHDIEEAQIVTADDASTSPAWEAVSLKTRKVEAAPEIHREAAPEPLGESLGQTAVLKTSKAANGNARVMLEAEAAVVIETVATARPTIDAHAIVREDAKPLPSAALAAVATSAMDEDPVASKSKFRFFSDSGETESVRLKVEKRPEERPAPETPAATAASIAAQLGARPEPKPIEPKPIELKAQSVAAPAAPVRPAEPVEAPKSAAKATNEAAAVAPAASQPVNLKSQKENVMEAKGQEIENGTGVKADGNVGAAIAIERNSKFSGQLKFSGAIAIDGQVEGELVAERIVVHEGGVVNATIEGNTVVIAGNVKGDVYARNELEILPSGIVHGSVTAPAINVRRGGRVEGRCAIGVPRA